MKNFGVVICLAALAGIYLLGFIFYRHNYTAEAYAGLRLIQLDTPTFLTKLYSPVVYLEEKTTNGRYQATCLPGLKQIKSAKGFK